MFIVIFVTSVIVVGVGFALNALGSAISEGAAVAYVTGVVASTLVAPIASLAVAIMYFQLSAAREAGGTAAGEPSAAPAA